MVVRVGVSTRKYMGISAYERGEEGGVFVLQCECLYVHVCVRCVRVCIRTRVRLCMGCSVLCIYVCLCVCVGVCWCVCCVVDLC